MRPTRFSSQQAAAWLDDMTIFVLRRAKTCVFKKCDTLIDIADTGTAVAPSERCENDREQQVKKRCWSRMYLPIYISEQRRF